MARTIPSGLSGTIQSSLDPPGVILFKTRYKCRTSVVQPVLEKIGTSAARFDFSTITTIKRSPLSTQAPRQKKKAEPGTRTASRLSLVGLCYKKIPALNASAKPQNRKTCGRELLTAGVERMMGIEPTTSAWEADVLPLNYTRISSRTVPADFSGTDFYHT